MPIASSPPAPATIGDDPKTSRNCPGSVKVPEPDVADGNRGVLVGPAHAPERHPDVRVGAVGERVVQPRALQREPRWRAGSGACGPSFAAAPARVTRSRALNFRRLRVA